MFNWGVKIDGGKVLYKNEGIPGNIASFPKTLTPQGESLRVLPLGAPHHQGQVVIVDILGVFEQVDNQGLTSTIIAVPTDQGYTQLANLENDKPSALQVIEAGLLSRYGEQARSLGYRSETNARKALRESLDRYQQ